MTPAALSRLLQLASPALPIGTYSYSQGLEWAIECGDVHDVPSVKQWLNEVIDIYHGRFELPVLKRLYQAWADSDSNAIQYWDARYTAGRDSAETLLESRQMGYSLLSLQNGLDSFPPQTQAILQQIEQPAFPTMYAASAVNWDIELNASLHAYVWSWLENQVSAAMKTIPLGQLAGQRVLTSVAEVIPQVVERAIELDDDDISNFCPALTIASCRHETQYSRLFRS